MQRKIISAGSGNGYTIYLPKAWIDKNQLSNKDSIEIFEQENTLIVSTIGDNQKKEISIDISNISRTRIRTAISGAYRKGAKTIVLTSIEPIDMYLINQTTNSLTGVIVQDQEIHKIILKVIADTSQEDIEKAINKMFFTIIYYATTPLLEKERQEINESMITQRDLLQRAINIHRFGKEDSYEYYVIIFLLEKLFADLTLIDTKNQERKKIAEFLQELREAHTTKNYHKIIEINTQLRKLTAEHQPKDIHVAITYNHLYSLSSRIVGIYNN